jgi:DNA polymerase III subunit beta
MKCTVKRDDLSRILTTAVSIVERKTTIPILSNIKLNAANGKLSITASDLEVNLFAEIPASVEQPGAVTIPGKTFNDLVREISSETISMNVGPRFRFELDAGQFRTKIAGTSADEYPSIPGLQLENSASIEAPMILEMLDKTAFSAASDEQRIHTMGGVLIEKIEQEKIPQGKKSFLRFVATDGHRLAVVDRPAGDLLWTEQVTLPRKSFADLRKVLETNDGVCHVGISESFLTIKSRECTLGIRLLDGKFPEYRAGMQITPKTTFVIEKQAFVGALRRVALLTADRSKTVRMSFIDKRLVIQSVGSDQGEATESLTVEQNGPDMTIGFSARFLQEAVNAMSRAQKITIELSSETGPGVFRSDDDDLAMYLVMPMRFEEQS